MGSNLILKDEVGEILLGLALANMNEEPPFFRALAAVAAALGQNSVVNKLVQQDLTKQTRKLPRPRSRT